MCGICGIVNFNRSPVRESEIRDMMNAVKHRGPDDEGIFIDKNIGLGFVRLSIIDLSRAGHQPMVSDDDRYVIIFNHLSFYSPRTSNHLRCHKKLINLFNFIRLIYIF